MSSLPAVGPLAAAQAAKFGIQARPRKVQAVPGRCVLVRMLNLRVAVCGSASASYSTFSISASLIVTDLNTPSPVFPPYPDSVRSSV